MTDEKQSRRKSWIAAGLLYLAGVGLVIATLILVVRMKSAKARQISTEARELRSEATAGPRVRVTTVETAPETRTITLLGESHAFLESTLYAKVTGYLKAINVDKGDLVKANQVLAVIESPETDAQYRAAVANAQNLAAIAERDRNLVERDMIARQDADTAAANARVAAQDVENLAALRSYEIIRAPFDGKITARFADPGALLQAAGTPVVRVSEIARERVYVFPDQADAARIRVGDPAEVSDPANPALKVAARVSRMSGEFDPNTRTMLTEIDFENRGGRIPPESFVEVTLYLSSGSRYIQIPADALVLRGAETLVAVIGPDNRVTYRPVVVEADDGTRVTIRSGLRRGERIALDIGESVPPGGRVQPVTSPAP